jgi:hypothetical protein
MFSSATLALDGRLAMKRWVMVFLALAVLTVFSFGCTGGASKEGTVRCPKCGSYFKTQEGADWFNNMGRF